MKIKKTTAIVAAILAGTSLASAQEMSISTAVAFESTYIFRGAKFADEFIAPSVDISYGDLYAGIWAALPLETAYESEVDYYAGYGFGLSETMSADVGFTYYTFPDSNDGFFDSDVNTFEIYGGLSFDAPLSPAVYAFYDLDLEAFTLEVSGGHSIEVSDSTSFDLSAYLGWVDGDGWDYIYYGAGAANSIAFTDNASASIFVNYYGSEEVIDDGDKYKFTFGASFSAGF